MTAASLRWWYVSAAPQLGVRLHIQNVAGLDDHAPASPNSTGTHQGGILGERELLGGTGEIGDTGDDEAPLANCLS